jgi:hypothetical protein
MTLTPLKIQVAIIKAFYSLALKSVKYYGGLAVGINNTCLFKEIRLLRAYIDILRNFTIVGSTITCHCCVEGDYTVLLNELSELTEAKIQFGCDNSGSMYYDEISYPFTYFYDSNNQKIEIKFSTLINPSTDEPYVLNLDGIEFTDNCSFEPNTISPIEVAVIEEVTETPVTADNIYAPVPNGWDGNITIYQPDDTVLPPVVPTQNPLLIPVDIIDSPQDVVDYWNEFGIPNWLLLYDGTQYTMLTPFDGTDYSGYTVVFSQYEGGQDSLALRTLSTFIPEPFVTEGTRAYTFIDIPNTFVGSVPATSVIEPAIPQPFITTPTLATAELVIPDTIFSTVQTPATMTIVIKDVAMFGTVNPTNQFFLFNTSFMFSHVGPYADPAALVSGFNSNNGNGFVMSYVGPSPTTPGLSIFEIESPISGQPFNDDIIKIIYTGAVSNQPITGTFSGGKSIKPLSLTVGDTIGLTYSVTAPSFSDVQDFITDFNTTLAGSYTVSLGVSNPGTSRLVFTPAGPFTAAYNNTPLTFTAVDPTYTGGTYINSNNYKGGIDTTECTYLLELYDSSNVLVLPVIENTTPTIYTSIADIATDIQNNPTNTYRFGTGVNTDNEITTNFPYEFELPQSLVCETYNGYHFVLSITYTSSAYGEYFSEFSYIDGGINAVSNQFEINDTVNNILFERDAGSYNYPNGSEITVGLINDFNDNNTFLYEAEYVEPGDPTPETEATVINNFLSELTAQGITFGQEVHAYIDSIDNIVKYLGKYQAPTTGILPSYSTMITNLNNDIVANNYVPGLTSTNIAGSIIQTSPPTQGGAFNGKLLQIIKIVYTPATIVLEFGAASPNTFFIIRDIDSTNICVFFETFFTTPDDVATIVESSINSSGTGYTATRVDSTVTISALPYTGESFNLSTISLQVYSGSVTINGNSYLPSPSFDIASFTGGLTTPTPVKQAAFAGGVAPIPTSRVKFTTPVQPGYGIGNFAYNDEELEYDYNSGDFTIIGTYLGGIDPTVGQFTAELFTPLPLSVLEDTLYVDPTPQNYASRQELVNAFNAGPDNLDFQITLPLVGNVVQFLSPPDSFSFFNDFIFRYSYNYLSPQYTDYENINSTFINGVDPTLTPYEGTFEEGDIGLFVNDNPCEETIAEQECLTNNDVNKIIAHIDKLAK